MTLTQPNTSTAVWEDLLGVPFVDKGRNPRVGLDCLGLALVMAQRLGYSLPDPHFPQNWREDGLDPFGEAARAGGWCEVQEADLRLGDLVALSWYGAGVCDHLSTALGDGYMLHAERGAGMVIRSKVAAARRSGKLLGFFRVPGAPDLPRELPPELAPMPQSGAVRVVIVRNILHASRQQLDVGWSPDLTLRRVLPGSWKHLAQDAYVATVNGQREEDLDALLPDRAFVVLTAVPGAAFLVSFAVALLVSALSYFAALIFAPGQPEPDNASEIGSPTFQLGGISNTALPGIAIPVVYGKHIVGGNIISVFFDVDGSDRQILYMLIALCEGPIRSIGGMQLEQNEIMGAQIPASIKINGNPASSYKEVRVSTRLGSEFQEPIAGFFNLNTAVPYSKTLLVGDPFIHISSQLIDSFRVVINFPIGLYNLNDEGATGSRPVTLKFSWRLQGTTVWTEQSVTWQEAKRVSFSRKFEKAVAQGIYEIKTERIAPPYPEPDADKESRADLVEVSEIRSDSLSHPGIALLALSFPSTDQLSGGSPPTVTAEIEGRTVWVWDGVSETNPNFGTQEVYSQNPAWCLLDAILHPRYGLAKQGYASVAKVDLSAFDEWADNCDLSVSDGRGGMIPRAQLDMVYDTVNDSWEVLQSTANSHWGSLMILGDAITVVTMKPKSPVALLNMGNAQDFALDYIGPKSRKNVIEVQFRNRETDYEADTASKTDPAVFTGAPVRKETINTIGVVRAAQAYRFAQFRKLWEEKVTKSFSIVGGIETIHILPGEVVNVSHEAVQWGKSGRTRLVGTVSTIKLDQDVTIVGGDRVMCRIIIAGQDAMEERTPTPGTYAAGAAIPVAPNWTTAPEAGAPYSIGALTTYIKPFLVMDIETEANFERKLTGMLYDASVYADDPGPVEQFTKAMPDNRLFPAPPSFVMLTEIEAAGPDGTVVPGVDVWIERENQTQAVDVFTRNKRNFDEPQTSWCWGGRTNGDWVRVVGFPAFAIVEVSVVPVSGAGTHVEPDRGTKRIITLAGRQRRPTNIDPTAVLLKDGNLQRLLLLPEHPDKDFARYDVRAGSSWHGSVRRMCLPCGENTVEYVVDQEYVLRPVNRSGKASGSQVAISGKAALNPPGYITHITADEQPAWSGVKTNTTDTGTQLELNVAGGLTGTYESPELDGLTVQQCWISVAVGATLKQEDMEWDEAGFAWDDAAFADMSWDDTYLSGFEPEADEDSSWDEMDIPWDSTLCNLRTWERATDMTAGLETLIEFRTHTGVGWTSWEKYVPQNRSLQKVQVRVTLKSPDIAYVPLLNHIKVRCYRLDTGTLVIDDPNNHYAGPDTLVGRSEEIGYVVAETTRNWFSNIGMADWAGALTYYGTPNLQGTAAADAVTTLLGFRQGLIPKWYQKSGANVFTARLVWSASVIPGVSQNWILMFSHKTFDAGDASFGTDTFSVAAIPVAPGMVANAPYEYVFNITSGDFAAGDLRFSFGCARLGGDAGDVYTGVVTLYSIEIVSGVKNT